jgi:eukaryotic-like serine/threonine-protein kinase
MDCPNCKARNPDPAVRCLQCNTPLPIDALTVGEGVNPAATLDVDFAKDWSTAATLASTEESSGLIKRLRPGFLLGKRYEIRDLLGVGGMGSVYKARDRELDRFVAIKVIRPDLAGQSEILRRFKQELILARQVTHKNVIRIFDLGEDGGIKFISMEYIDGQNLKSKTEHSGRLSYEESVGIVQQICLALEAAHSEGVIHRDLKPHNIMIDKHGKVSVMDFGIARSVSSAGLTMTGAFVGTPDYMSPEQVKGESVDARSDLFSLGIIFYQLLTEKTPYAAKNTESAMFKRTRERARAPLEEDPQVPRYLSDVVAKCLEMDPRNRYQSSTEIWNALERWKQGATSSRLAALNRTLQRHLSPARAAAALLVLLLVAGTLVFRGRFATKATAKPANAPPLRSLAIFPFRNASGDPKLDWLGSSMAQMLTEDVGQSTQLRTVPADRANQIFLDLRLAPDAKLDMRTIGRLAEYSNADVIVSGQFAKLQDQLQIEATVQDTKHGHSVTLRKNANGEKDVLSTVENLAGEIRSNLALTSGAIRELETGAIRPSSTSLEALRHYDDGLQDSRKGDYLEASKQFLASTKEDPNFALAFSRLAETYALLGQDNDAEVASLKAVELSGALPPQERYLISALHAKVLKDYQKAIASYVELAKVQPGDTDILFDLAGLYESLGEFDKAREYYGKVRSLDPKRIDAMLAHGRVEIKSGNAGNGLDYLSAALNLAIQFNHDEERANILQAEGVAYQELNRLPEALGSFQSSLEIKRRLGLKSGMASSLSAIAQVQQALGKPDLALGGYTESLKLLRETGDKAGAAGVMNDLGNFYNDRGKYDQALTTFKECLQIQIELGDEQNQGQALNNIGLAHLSKGDYQDAHIFFDQALQRREKFPDENDIAESLHNLAETSTNLGLFDQALDEYLRSIALRRKTGNTRGVAIENYSMGAVFALRGRYGAAMSANDEALKTFKELGERGYWLAHILSGHGAVLVQLGKAEQAREDLDEALKLAVELQNQGLISKIKGIQGDSYFYRGDPKAAGPLYRAAYDAASHTTDRQLALTNRLNLAKLSVEQTKSQNSIHSLQTLREDANAAGLKYLSLQCSFYLSKAFAKSKRYAEAEKELQHALVAGEKLGTNEVVAQCHHLLGRVAAETGNKVESQRQHQEALRILTAMQQEAHNDLQGRSDLAPILAAQN